METTVQHWYNSRFNWIIKTLQPVVGIHTYIENGTSDWEYSNVCPIVCASKNWLDWFMHEQSKFMNTWNEHLYIF